MNKKVLVIAGFAKSLCLFRLDLIKDFVEKGFEVVACAPADQETASVIECLEAINVKFLPIQLTNTGLNIIKDLFTILNLYKVMRQENPDIVLSYTIKPVIYGSIAAKLAKVKNIYSMITGLGYVFITNTARGKVLRYLVSKLYKFALQFNRKVFFQNPDDLNLFLNNKLIVANNAVLINGSGVNISYYSVAPLPNACAFTFMGRFLHDKGIFEFIEAAKILKKKYSKVVFYLVGALYPNPTSITQKSLDELISQKIISYLGKLDDVRPALAKSSVLVLPSYREGTPRSVLEAMSMGRPIITTDAPGCRETVNDGVNGFLVPVKNVEKLVAAMEKFILNPQLIPSMGAESRHIAEDKYDVTKVNAVILQAMGMN